MGIENDGDISQTVEAVTEGQNLIKACLFNLIVLCNDPQRIPQCEHLVQVITEKYPCKIIFVRQDPQTAPETIRTRHLIHTIGAGSNTIVCDEISIEVSSKQFANISFFILPHLVSDLPIYLLLANAPSIEQTVLHQLQKYATRFIFDMERIEKYGVFAERMLELIGHNNSDYIDINWSKTKAWREVLVYVFHSKKTISQLQLSKSIQISYACPVTQPQDACEIQAVFFQAWLASIFGWKLESIRTEDRCRVLTYTHSGGQLTMTLIPKDTEILLPGALFSVEVLTHGDFHFLLSHEGQSKQIRVHASNPELCEIPYAIFLTDYQRGTALVGELFYQPESEHYAKMLSALTLPQWSK
jgi:glucose-6-phosphate dehydrogenase assembly protein OpcA